MIRFDRVLKRARVAVVPDPATEPEEIPTADVRTLGAQQPQEDHALDREHHAQGLDRASTWLGPFHVTRSPERAHGESIDLMGGAEPCVVAGRVLDPAGTALADAVVDVWQCTEEGFYAVQQPGLQPPGNGRGLFRTDAEGRFAFRTVVPSHYPIPVDGPVGALLWRRPTTRAVRPSRGDGRRTTGRALLLLQTPDHLGDRPG